MEQPRVGRRAGNGGAAPARHRAGGRRARSATDHPADFANLPVELGPQPAAITATNAGHIRAALVAPIPDGWIGPTANRLSVRATAATTLQALELTQRRDTRCEVERGRHSLASEAANDPGRWVEKIYPLLARPPSTSETLPSMLGLPPETAGVADFPGDFQSSPEFHHQLTSPAKELFAPATDE
jgi:hypothetical protein